MREAQLHRAVADFLRVALKPPVIWTTFPAGGGGRVRGAQLKAAGLRTGWPDIIIMAPHLTSTRVIGIELKTAGGRLSDAQVDMAEAFDRVLAVYETCRSVEDVETALRYRGIELHATALPHGHRRAA